MSGAHCSPIVLRTKGAVALCGVVEARTGLSTFSTLPGECVTTSWNSQLSSVLLHRDASVHVVKLTDESGNYGQPTVTELSHPAPAVGLSIRWTSLSPGGRYAAVMYAAPPGNANVFIYSIEDSAVVLSEAYSAQLTADRFVWRDDDQVFGVYQSGAVTFRRLPDGESLGVVAVAGEVSLHLAPARSGESVVAFIFKACTYEAPIATMQIVRLTDQKEAAIVAVENFERVDGVECLWSSSGTYMLCVASAQVDARGQNYGCVGDVWFKSMADLATPFEKINHAVVQEVAWSPRHEEFIMIEGKSPSDCSLVQVHEATVEGGERARGRPGAPHTFHRGYKNTIRWAPHGDMLILGGFGNLAGDLALFARGSAREGGAIAFLSERRCPCTVKCEWSPCGRYFFTASLWPRMRVDNQVTIWSRPGAMLSENPFEDSLYDVVWPNLAQEEYPELPVPEAPAADAKTAAGAAFLPKGQTSDSAGLIQLYISGMVKLEDLPAQVQAKLKSNTKLGGPARAAGKAKQGGGNAINMKLWRGGAAEEPPTMELAPPKTARNAKKQFSPPSAAKAPAGKSEGSTTPHTAAEEHKPRQPLPVLAPRPAPPAPMHPGELPAGLHPPPSVLMHAPLVRPPVMAPPCGPPVGLYSPALVMPPPQLAPMSNGGQGGNIVSLLQQILPPSSTVHIEGPLRTNAYRYPPPPPPPAAAVSRWFYTDPRGQVQGPFSRRQMRAWWEKGYFPHSLRVRTEQDAQFRPLSYYYPESNAAFSF